MPLVAADGAKSEQGPSDVLLGGTVAQTIECLQHPARPRPLLASQSGVGRNGATVKCRQKSVGGLQPAESIKIQRDDSHCWSGRCAQDVQLDPFAVSE